LLVSKKLQEEGQSQEEMNQKLVDSMKYIDEALKLHITMTKSLIPGFDFYIRLNPDFLMSLA